MSRRVFFWQRHRGVITTSAIVAVLLSAIVFSVMRTGATQPPQITEPPANLLPGHPLPPQAECLWPPYGIDYTVSCRVKADGKSYHLSYDSKRHIIIETSTTMPEFTLGNLILLWGTPTGVKRYEWATEVYWHTRYAYTYATKPLSPFSAAAFIVYTLQPFGLSAWTGFGDAR